jgi:hypothetical protein
MARLPIPLTAAFLSLAALPFLLAPVAQAKILRVGPGRPYKTPCLAMPHTRSGDIVEIDADGKYDGDVCTWTADRLTLRGVGPTRAHIDAAGRSAQNKAIWVIAGSDATIDSIEFSGATSSDGNGAAIRQEGKNLHVYNCYFHDNQEGILAGDNPHSTILVEFSEFAHNGTGDGRTHNIYISFIAEFTLRFSYSHHANVGHLLKTRAAVNHILYNRLGDEAAGNASFEIDISNGGTADIIGNVIQKGPDAENSSMLAYKLEGADPRNPGSRLYVGNNTFVNDRPEGGIFIQTRSDAKSPPLVVNNIFWGKGTLTSQPGALLVGNLVQRDPLFLDSAHYDYRLREQSPARGVGVVSDGFVVPDSQYSHPACGARRGDGTKPDVGAFSASGSSERIGPPRCQADPASVTPTPSTGGAARTRSSPRR